MRRILVIISCMLSTFMAMAQEYNLRWISSPCVDSTAQIWFRNQYVHHKKIKKAYVCIATTGYADLYINRRNASRNYLAPYRQPYSDYPVSTTYDITRFSRPDTTTIAVWYSPSYPHINNRQLSLIYYGTYQDGSSFSFASDESWLCRPSCSQFNSKGSETIDGRIDKNEWKANQINDLALWQGCKKQPISSSEYPHSTDNLNNTIESIIPYRYFDIEKDTITYDFGLGLIGFARVTLRGARKGERIFIGDMEYICSGQLDEQACLRFTTMPVRKLTIYGDNKFRADHIVNVEGISIISH